MNSLVISCVVMILATAFRGYRRGLYGLAYGIATWALVLAFLPLIVIPIRNELSSNQKLTSMIEEKVDPYVGMFALSALSGSDFAVSDGQCGQNNDEHDKWKHFYQNVV